MIPLFFILGYRFWGSPLFELYSLLLPFIEPILNMFAMRIGAEDTSLYLELFNWDAVPVFHDVDVYLSIAIIALTYVFLPSILFASIVADIIQQLKMYISFIIYYELGRSLGSMALSVTLVKLVPIIASTIVILYILHRSRG